MGTHVQPIQKPSDDPKLTRTTSPMPPHQSTSCPPETPPLVDPNNFRFPRLTPNLKEMIHSWNPAFHDATTPSTDIFASPDPTAMYNAIAMPSPSPLLKDFYQGQSPMIGMVPPYLNAEISESRAQRAEKFSVVCEEMNGLFANLPHAAEAENRSDNNVDGVASNVSSPDRDEIVEQPHLKTESIPEQTQTTATTTAAVTVKSRNHTSQSSCETRPVLDTSSLSPSSSPQLTDTRVVKKTSVRTRKKEKLTPSSTAKKSGSKSNKPKRPPTRPQTLVKPQPKLTGQIPGNATVSAMAAANAFAMNPALAGLIPFPGAMAAGNPQMYPGAGVMLYQGRPMVFVAGARGPELIPIDMLTPASSVHYGAAQALQVAGHMNHTMGSHAGASQAGSPYESSGGSRKKRRRQMLERSGCSEEQARENRARALKRLRQKKTVRCQSSTVRYACRKRIAMVRPRVNGRFATKEEVEQNEQEALLNK